MWDNINAKEPQDRMKIKPLDLRKMFNSIKIYKDFCFLMSEFNSLFFTLWCHILLEYYITLPYTETVIS